MNPKRTVLFLSAFAIAVALTSDPILAGASVG